MFLCTTPVECSDHIRSGSMMSMFTILFQMYTVGEQLQNLVCTKALPFFLKCQDFMHLAEICMGAMTVTK